MVAAGKPPVSPFALLSAPSTRAQQRRCAETWSARLPAADVPAPELPPADPARKLRIGYLSADFHEHATAALAAGVFEAHDRTRVRARCAYSTGPDDGSAMRARLVRAFDRFVDARRLAVGQLAAQIRADGIDVLVDLKGHTAGAPTDVLALRPAPVQAQCLGYPGTIGGAVGRLAARRRRSSRRPGTRPTTPRRWCACPAATSPTTAARPAPSRRRARRSACPTAAFVLCCFNQTYKINPAVFDAWTRILPRCPAACCGCSRRGEPIRRPPTCAARRAARGVDPARLVFARATPNARLPRAVPARRPVPRHLAVQRAHDGERRAVGGLPGADLAGRDLRRPGRREPAGRGRACPSWSPAAPHDYVAWRSRWRGTPAGGTAPRAPGGPGRSSALFDAARSPRARGRLRPRWRGRVPGGNARAAIAARWRTPRQSRRKASASATRADGDDLDAVDLLLRLVGSGSGRREAELRGLANALLAALHRADLAGEADLAKNKRFGRQRLFRMTKMTASSTARSAAGSAIRTPPTALTKTS